MRERVPTTPTTPCVRKGIELHLDRLIGLIESGDTEGTADDLAVLYKLSARIGGFDQVTDSPDNAISYHIMSLLMMAKLGDFYDGLPKP